MRFTELWIPNQHALRSQSPGDLEQEFVPVNAVPTKDTLDVSRIFPLAYIRIIQSYRDKRTRDFAEGKRAKAFSAFARKAEQGLDQLDAATSLLDLDLPGNRLESLKADRKGQYSVRINDQWRICSEWPEGERGPCNVEIVDYH